MTEQEAQAVLVVLGPQLEWGVLLLYILDYPGFMWETAAVRAREGKQEYLLGFNPEDVSQTKAVVTCHYHSDQPDLRTVTPHHWYESVTQAKTACEIHAANGMFPPCVPPPILTVIPVRRI